MKSWSLLFILPPSAFILLHGYGGRMRTYVNLIQSQAPFQLGHSVMTFPIANCRLPICSFFVPGVFSNLDSTDFQSELVRENEPIENRQLAMIWWTWHDLNVRPRPSQSRALIPLSYRSREISDCGFRIAELKCLLSEKNKIRNPQSAIRNPLAEGYGVEP